MDLLGYPRPNPVGTAADIGAFEVALDFGDAPDPSFPTGLTHDGARHQFSSLFLGTRIDAEPDGQPHPAAKGDDKAAIDAALQTFQEKAQKLGEVIYKAAQEEQAAEGGAAGDGAADASSGQPADDEPVDADFEVKS